MTAVAQPRDTRPYDQADLSSRAFWSQTAAEREKTYAVLRAERPVTWHQPVEDMLMTPRATKPSERRCPTSCGPRR